MMTEEQKKHINEYMQAAPPIDDKSWSEPIEKDGYIYRISFKGYVYKLPWVEIGKNGMIRHKAGLVLRPHVSLSGALLLNIGVLHNIIYAHYMGTFDAQMYRICYKDGNIYNNALSNLVKVTREKFQMDDDESISEKDYLAKFYRVTKDGRIFRLSDNKELATVNGPKGYRYIRLKATKFSKNKDRRKSYKVHRLVAMFYLKDYSDELQVNHINGNKQDNRVENLEMVTNQENVIHAYTYLDSSYRRHVLSERTRRSVIEQNTGRKFKSIKDACVTLSVSRTAIYRSLKRNVPCRNGLQFKYCQNG